jgi:hypothetical protein
MNPTNCAGAAKEEDINMPCFVLQDLQNILSKLRNQYQYCLYCGCKVSFVLETQFFIQHLLYLFKLDAFSYFVQYESPEVLANECPGPDNTVSPFFQHPNFFTLLNLVITSPCLLTDCFLV